MARDESGRVSRQPVFKGYFFGVENAPGPIAPGAFPGERVTHEIVEYLEDLTERAVRVSGQEAEALRTVRIVASH
jgi:hypothetical protein